MAGLRDRLAQWMHRTKVLSAVLRARAALRVPVLTAVTYHHVDEPTGESPFDPGVADATPEQFRRQMELIARYGTPITMAEACRILCEGARVPPNPVLVTFDDGYRSCLEVAVPILRTVGVPATFFIATSFITERRLFWWERISVLLAAAKRRGLREVRLALPSAAGAAAELTFDASSPQALETVGRVVKSTAGLDVEQFLVALGAALGEPWTPARDRQLADQLIMTWDQVRALAAAGMDVESHTRSHRVLRTVPVAELADELAGSRQDLERELGRPVCAIAYPVGHSLHGDAQLRRAVQDAGYRLGFTNASGTNPVLPGPLQSLAAVDTLEVRRLAMGRDYSDSMFLGQLAVPQLAHRARSLGG